jgi:hypothetical protein
VRGVVSARRRATRHAWEIDTLIAADEDSGAVTLNLFDQVVAGAVRSGVHKVFLRLEAGSDLLEPAHRAGFVSYARETLLRLDPPHPTDAPPPSLDLRPREKGDAFALYQLYSRATPEDVRRYEAVTFQEWLAANEERSRGRGRIDLIGEQQSRAMAWVRASRADGLGRVDLLIHPDAWCETEALLAAGLSALRPEHPAYCLVREHARPVHERLEASGFTPAGHYVSMVKRLAVPVRELRPRRLPVPALVKPLVVKPLAPAMSARGTITDVTPES